MDFVSAELFSRFTPAAIVVAFALAVITDKLVWHTRLKTANDRADRWEKIALEALTAGAQAGIRAAEVTVDVVGSLPDPEKLRQEAAVAAATVIAEAAIAEDTVRRAAADAAEQKGREA